MSRRKRIILVGRTMSGKTTLSQRITDSDIRYHKTQTLTLIDDFILDTPGEYFERYSFRGSLTVAATDADVIVFVQDATEDGTLFPPAYGALFCKPVIGLVTKADIATDTQISNARTFLKMAGAKVIFVTSALTGKGLDDFVCEISYTEETTDERQ